MMFAVCGEALFDVFATGRTPTGLALDARIGGSPFNVAVGLSRLGQRSALVTVLSQGFLGERLVQALSEEGVEWRLSQRSAAPTTLSLVGLDPQGVPSYAFYGDQGADRLLDESVLLAAWPDDVACIHVGSYATVVGRTAQTQRLLIEREHHRSLISYDPNVRLNVEPDPAVWRAQIDWMLTRTHLLKISDEDLELLYPGLPLQTFAERALAAGVQCVVVTRGGQGAWGWTPELHVVAQPVRVAVVDTVGAGDTFQAALLTWLAENDGLRASALGRVSRADLESALAFASSAAAVTCSRRGADLPRRADLLA